MLEKLFTKRTLLCSDTKTEGYTYKSREEAIEMPFIQFNANCVSTISIDIDYCTEDELNNRLELVPLPSIIVKTSKGYHVHWALSYPISYNNMKGIKWLNEIKRCLKELLKGDEYALGNKRIFRNPMLHESTFNDIEYSLMDFGIPYPKRSMQRSFRTKKANFTAVKVGERHMSLFNYLRISAYSLGNRDDLSQVLTYLAEEANNTLEDPLSTTEVSSIVNSICKFMVNYTGTKEQTQYNKTLAKRKHKNTISKVITSLKPIGITKANKMSSRGIAKVSCTSNSTVSLHRHKIFDLFKCLVVSNIAMSTEEFIEMNINNYSDIDTVNNYIGGLDDLSISV